MILCGDRTKFQEDLGIWLARWPRASMGTNKRWGGNRHRGDGWCAYRRYHNAAMRRDRALWLKINIDNWTADAQSAASHADNKEKS